MGTGRQAIRPGADNGDIEIELQRPSLDQAGIPICVPVDVPDVRLWRLHGVFFRIGRLRRVDDA